MAEHPHLREAADRARARRAERETWTPDADPNYHSRDASTLRLHGAGDGSVMAYCGSCREPLPHLPRPATLGAVEQAWRDHLAALEIR